MKGNSPDIDNKDSNKQAIKPREIRARKENPQVKFRERTRQQVLNLKESIKSHIRTELCLYWQPDSNQAKRKNKRE